MQDAAERFQKVFDPWAASCNHEYITWIGLRTRAGTPHLLYATRLFSFLDVRFEEFHIETRSLIGGRRHILHPEEIRSDEIAAVLKDPRLLPGDLASFHCASSSFSEKCRPYFEYNAPPRWRGQRRTPGVIYHGNFEQQPDFPDDWELDQELVGADVPFSGLADLLTYLDIPIEANRLRHEQRIEVLISAPARFSTFPTLRNDSVYVGVQAAANAELDQVSLAARVEGRDQPVSRRQIKATKVVDRGARAIELEFVARFPGAVSAQLFLTYSGGLCETAFVRDPSKFRNPLMVIHSTVGPERALAESLTTTKGRDFESAIGVLLGLLGLSVLPYGGAKPFEDAAPDIVAVSRADHIYLVECTTGDIDNHGKLLQFSKRVDEIRETLAAHNLSHLVVQGILATNLARLRCAVHLEKLANYQIALLAKEDIDQLIGLVDPPKTPAEVHALVCARIPLIPSGAALGNPGVLG